MKKTIIIAVSLIAVVLLTLIFVLTHGKKNTTTTTTTKTTQNAKEIQLSADEMPTVNLIPREDGHQLTLKVTNIPSKFASVDYELVYSAMDQGLEIDKGVSGTVSPTDQSFQEDLLLGTSSCTAGCKYSYDEGVTGGTLSLTLTTSDKQYVTFETPFVLRNSTQINKDKNLSLTEENFTINGTVTSKNDFFIAIKNFKSIYSVFSSGTGTGKVSSISPSTVTKENLNSFIGDYLIP
jgi:hypothetical protein